jgi:hypothetical protein
MGATPHRLAKEASLLNLWGLSPATISSVAAWSVPMPAKETNSGRLALPTDRAGRLARRSLPRGPGNGGPPNGGRTWSPTVHREGHLRCGSVWPPRRAPSSRVRADGRGVHPVPSGASPEAGWQPARPRLHSGATSRPQGPDHLHAAVSALWHARRFAGQHRSCGALGVRGVGLLDVTARASLPALRALHLKHLDSPGLQLAGESCPRSSWCLLPRRT